MHINKVSRVRTISQVAKELGENENWLFDVAAEMEPEDGLIWVSGIGDDAVMAFTDFGVETLTLLWQIWFHRFGEWLVAMRASHGGRPREEIKYGLPDGRHARLRRRPSDSFFSVPPL